MNISKYIELLRFYLTEKIDTLDSSIKNTFSDEIQNIISSILSALFSLFISKDCIDMDGFWGVLIKIVLVIVLYFVFKYIISKLLNYRRTKNEIEKSDKKELSTSEAKKLIDRFDNVACDGIILSNDFLKKYDDKKLSICEKQFALIESFYYYKKAVEITYLIIYNSEHCINNEKNVFGVSKYRLNNVYNLLNEISENINSKYINSMISPIDEFTNEKELADDLLGKIYAFISNNYNFDK